MFKASNVLKLLYEENHVNIILTAKEMEIHKLCWTSAKSQKESHHEKLNLFRIVEHHFSITEVETLTLYHLQTDNLS